MSGFPTQGYFYIISRKSGKVLDVKDAEVTAKKSIIVWERKEDDNDNQLWQWDDGFLVNKKSGLVMDASGDYLKSGIGIIQYDRKATKAYNQRWDYRDGYVLVCSDPRLVLHIKDEDETDATAVILSSKSVENDCQQWLIETA